MEKEVNLASILGKDDKDNLFVKGDKLYNTIKVVDGKTVYLGTSRNRSYLKVIGKEPKDIMVEERLGNTDNLVTLLDETTFSLVENTLIQKDLSNINNKEDFDVIANYLINLVGYDETKRIFEIGFKIANKLTEESDNTEDKLLRENRIFLLKRFREKFKK